MWQERRLPHSFLPNNQTRYQDNAAMDIFELIRAGNLKTIEDLIDSKDLTVDDQWLDYEALNTSLQFGRREVAKYLLDKNCRVNKPLVPPKPPNTPLHHAVLLQDAELVDALLKKGASLTAVNADGNSSLHLAFSRENHRIIDRILDEIQRTSDHTNVKNKQDLSHLHIACTRSNGEIIRNYLDNGANVNDKVCEESLAWAGYDAMKFAIEFQSSVAMEVLREAKTPTEPIDDDFIESTVMLAEVCKVMDDFYEEFCYEKAWEFHEACHSKNNVAVIKRFIEYETSVNTHIHSEAEDFPGYTPLHFAVEGGSIENVRLLLRRGASVDRINCAQMTPLHLALYNEDPDKKSAIVDVLYKALKDKTQVMEDENLLSLFHVAVTRNKLRTVEEFLDDGEDVNQRVMSKTPKFPGYAPVHFAVRYGLQNMTMYLVRRGANLNQMSGHGSPLDIAREIGHEGLIRMVKANRVGA